MKTFKNIQWFWKMKTASHKYTVLLKIIWYAYTTAYNNTVLLEKRLHINEKSSSLHHFIVYHFILLFIKSRQSLPFNFGKHCLFYKSHLFPLYSGEHWIFKRSRQCLPYYFEEHCIFMRSRLHFSYHFGEHLIFLKSRQCIPFYYREHCIFMISCLHLPFYHVWLWWRKKLQFF